MSTTLKHIVYQFDIDHEVEVDKVETKTEGEGENAKTITVTTKVKENRPITFAVKKPNKIEREECEIVRDASFKYFVDRGIITEGNLRKQYGDNGGVYTNEEETHYSTLRDKMRVLITDYQSLALSETEDDKKKASSIFREIFEIRQQIIDFEKTANLFYERTAEAKAQKKAIEHFLIHLTYTKVDTPVDKPIEWTPYFKGSTSEEKLSYLAQLEDDADLTYLKIRDKVMLICLLLITSNVNLTPEQVQERVEEAEISA